MHAKFDHNTGIYYAIYEKMYLDKDFQGNIVLTLTFDIETLFKVTASFIYKYVFYVECDIIRYVKDEIMHVHACIIYGTSIILQRFALTKLLCLGSYLILNT